MNDRINHFIDSSMNKIRQSIEIPYLADFVNKINGGKSIMNLFIIGSGILFCLLIGMMWDLFRSFREKLNYITIIFAGTGLSFLILPLWFYLNNIVSRVGVLTKSLYEFIKTYLTAFDLIFVKTGFSIIFLSVGIYVLYSAVEYRRNHTKVNRF